MQGKIKEALVNIQEANLGKLLKCHDCFVSGVRVV